MAQMKDTDASLREHLIYLLGGGGAHLNFESSVAGLPARLYGAKPPGLEFTPWRILEHMRLAQRDIFDFCVNPKYVELEFPAGYWPEADSPPSPAAWGKSVKQFLADLGAMQKLVRDPKTDLYSRIPHGTGQTVLREALLVADHNAYHLGQIVMVRRLLGAWTKE